MIHFEFDNFDAATKFLTAASFGHGATEPAVLVKSPAWVVVGAVLPSGMTPQLGTDLAKYGGVVFTGTL